MAGRVTHTPQHRRNHPHPHPMNPISFISVCAYTVATPDDVSVRKDGDTLQQYGCQECCMTNCIDCGTTIIHVELKFQTACPGNGCIVKSPGYSVSDNITCRRGKVHTVIYGVRDCNSLWALCTGIIPPDERHRYTGGIKRYVDRNFVKSGDAITEIFFKATPDQVTQARHYLDDQIRHTKEYCGSRCGGGYNYIGCICLPFAKPLMFMSNLLNPCKLNRLLCPPMSYRKVGTADSNEPIRVYNNWFCSELCAAALMYAGIIPDDHPPAWYSPARVVTALPNLRTSGTVIQLRKNKTNKPDRARLTDPNDFDIDDDADTFVDAGPSPQLMTDDN